VEHILALKRLQEAVHHPIRNDELEVLVIFYESVLRFLLGQRAVGRTGTDVEPEVHVEATFFDLGVGCHSPVDLHVRSLVQLGQEQGEVGNLILEVLIGN